MHSQKIFRQETLHAWLEKLGAMRIELKIRRFEERLRQLARERIHAVYEQPREYEDGCRGRSSIAVHAGTDTKRFFSKRIVGTDSL